MWLLFFAIHLEPPTRGQPLYKGYGCPFFRGYCVVCYVHVFHYSISQVLLRRYLKARNIYMTYISIITQSSLLPLVVIPSSDWRRLIIKDSLNYPIHRMLHVIVMWLSCDLYIFDIGRHCFRLLVPRLVRWMKI